MEAVALASAFVVAFVVAQLAIPSVGPASTRGAFAGALALGMAGFLACGIVYNAPASPLDLDDWIVILAGLVALAAPVERALGLDRPLRVHAVRALMASAAGAGMLFLKFWAPDWPLNQAAGAAVAAGGWIFAAALLLDGLVDRRPAWAGANLGAWVAVTIGFLVGGGSVNFGVIGGALGLGVLALLGVRYLDRTAKTEAILHGAPLVLATILGALVVRSLVYTSSMDRPPLACGALLLAAAAAPRVGDLLRDKLGPRADALGLALLLALGGIAAAIAASITADGGGPQY